MCGINGFFAFSEKKIENHEQLLGKMNNLVAHRGPDDAGIWSNTAKGIYFGHRRLSIIDLSNHGHQPMISKHGNALVFNGEVYNYEDIKSQLENTPYLSNSDTEVVLRSFEQKGIKAVNSFNGMFALAYWSDKNNSLTLVRDRIGIKPLYYSQMGGVFSFSSEIRSLLALPWIKKQLDDKALYDFLTFNHLEAPDTMFIGINKLEPGSCLEVGQTGTLKIRQYWDVQYSNIDSLIENAIQESLLDKFDQSVQLRTISDVPVGAFLSGGVDSSAIVASMANSVGQINTFSIGFEGQPDYDELRYAEQVATQFSTNHFEKTITKQDVVEFLPLISEIFDEPLADATSIPIYFISKLAREHNTPVVLTGDGADELFSGYRKWMQYSKIYPFYRLAERLPSIAKKTLSVGASKIFSGRGYADFTRRLANNQELFWGGAGAFKESEKKSILTSSHENVFDSYEIIDRMRKQFERIDMHGRKATDVDWMCHSGIKSIVPNYYLHRADRLGMANSIELRVPFMDHEFVNFGLSISGHLKVKNSIPKYILKKAMESRLDKELLYRKKQGFCVPLKNWGKDMMVADLLRDKQVFSDTTQLFDINGITEMVKGYAKGQYYNDNAIWNLYFLNTWLKKWVL